MKAKKKWPIFILVAFVLGLIIFIVIKLSEGFKKINNALADDLPSTYSIPSEDSSLIAKKYLARLKIEEVVRSKNRGPIAFIFFDKAYYLIIYKIDLIKDTTLNTIFHASIESAEKTVGTVYTVVNHNDFFRFQYQVDATQPVSNVYLTLAGDSLVNLAKNDSLISYHFLCENFSIKYSKNEPIDILVEGTEKMFGTTTVVPMDLLFLKRNHALYALMMTDLALF